MDESTLKLALAACGAATALTAILAGLAWWDKYASAKDARQAAKEAHDEESGGAAGPVRFAGLGEMMGSKNEEEVSALKRDLAMAGLRSPEALSLFNVVRSISILVGGLLLFLMVVLTGFSAGGLMAGAILLLIGLMGPKLWLRSRINKRQDALTYSLPPTLDLLTTCIEAGLGLEQAMERVAREMGFSDPEMAEELSVVVGEIRAGLSVGTAFRKFADRVRADEIRNLTNVIIQSAALGASLGRTLREYAASARRRRELSLEESAGKVTAGLTLPLTLCLLPSAVIAMLGPAVVIVVNTLFE